MDSSATATPTLWARHSTLAKMWCAIRDVADGSYSTYCAGKFNVADAAQFDVCANPTRKCRACERVIDAERVHVGLRELADSQSPRCRVHDTACINPAYCDARDACCAGDIECKPVRALFDAEMPDDLFDDGGES